MEWKNRVTEMLGCKYPIMEGAFHGFGTSALAAPISEAGGFGMITAGAFRKPEQLRDDIRECRSMTDKPFGVNITIGLCPHAEEMREVALEEGIKVIETAAFRADEHVPRIKEAGAKWLHKVSSVRHGRAAEKQGADAVIVVGIDGIGFKSPEQLPTLISTRVAANQAKIPVIAAGGFGDAQTFMAGLALGAEAVYMATVFMGTEECPIGSKYKQRLVEARAWDKDYLGRALYQPPPEEYAKILAKRGKTSMEEWLPELENLIQGYEELSHEELEKMTGVESMLRVSRGSLAVDFINKVMPVKDLMENIINGAEEIQKTWGISR